MRQATVSFHGDIAELYDLAVFHDAGLLDVEVLSCEGTSGIVRIRVEDTVDEQRLDESTTIEWWERVASEGTENVYLFEGDAEDTLTTEDPDIDGWPRCEAIAITEQGYWLSYVGSQDQLSAMVAHAQANEIDVALRRLHDYRTEETPIESLTKRQREVLTVAFDRGYYDIPRSASTKEIAAEVDLDDSTVSEHLQRAERNLLRAVLGRST